MLASLALEDLDDYMLQEGNYYDFGECSSLKEFCERLIPVGRLVGAVKEILFYATRKGSKVILMVGKGEDGFSSVLARCCKYQGVYLSNVELENRAGDNGVDSSSQFYRMVGRSLQNMDYQSVRLFSDNKDNLKAFLNLRSRFDELLFEGYWVGASGFPRVMM